MSRPLILTLAFLAQACSTSHVVTKPVSVEVVRDRYVSLPADFLAPCPNKPVSPTEQGTVGTMYSLEAQYRLSYVPWLEGKLQAIRDVQP